MALLIPEYLQTKTYSAMRLRQVLMDQHLQEGVVGAVDLAVAQRAAGGANMSVDVAAGAAFVRGDLTSRQGLYHVYNDGIVNLAIGANTSGNPRVDQVIARVYDSQDGLAGADQATLEVLPGTATAGATLDNRSGAAALPLTAVRLADVLVASGTSSIVASNIRDRRPWARGGFSQIQRTAGSASASTTTPTTIFAADMQLRLEVSSGLVRVQLNGVMLMAASVYAASHFVVVDGTFVQQKDQSNVAAVAANHVLDYEWYVPVAANASHFFGIGYKGSAASTTTWTATAAQPLQLVVEEIMQPNANNGSA